MSNYILATGDDCYMPDPGEWEEKYCSTCGDKMDVKRNVMGATSWAEAMGNHKHLHDTFTCPNAGTVWHVQVIKLKKAVDKTPSSKLEQVYKDEISEILRTRKHTKEVSMFFLD